MPVDEPVKTSTVVVCTLWEGDYHKGAAALTNSLYAKGFRGRIWAAYRGALPPWATGGVAEGAKYTYTPAPGLEVVFVKLETKAHFAHLKPYWCREVLNTYDPAATGVYYFDPDIVALAKWEFFENWIEYGIAVCEDSHYPLNSSHPIARYWREFAVRHGYELHRPAEAYLNSGMVGLKREYLSFLDDWERITDLARAEFKIGDVLRYGNRADMFHQPDQDTCTLATWTTVHPVSRVGVDAMAFDRGGWLIAHAVFSKKPWRRKPLHDLLKLGFGPDIMLRLYWDNVSSPIQIESPQRVASVAREIRIAAFLGRFYRRPHSVI